MHDGWLRIGELARRTGVSVRTLHHYHEIGLLVPSHHSPGEQRGYGRADVERLLQIRALRSLGLSLDEVRATLEGASPLAIVERRVRRVAEELAAARDLKERLDGIVRRLRAAETPGLDELLAAIERNEMLEKYYTQEQLEALAARREQVGEERMRAVGEEWNELFARFRERMAAGADPCGADVLALARRARALVAEFTGGDPGIARSLDRLVAEEPAARERAGMDDALMAYMARARRALEAEG